MIRDFSFAYYYPPLILLMTQNPASNTSRITSHNNGALVPLRRFRTLDALLGARPPNSSKRFVSWQVMVVDQSSDCFESRSRHAIR